MPKTLARWLLGLIFVYNSSFSQTQPTETFIPQQLKDWRSWVLQGYEYRACPFITTELAADTVPEATSFICAWPGKLSINADAKGATFSQHWRLDAAEWVVLPGDAENWPQELTVNGQRYPVLKLDDEPAIRLEAGNYDIRGRILWSERPQVLRVPETIGLIELSVDGKNIAPLERDAESLTLGRAESGESEAESLTLRVFRKVSDGLPSTLDTKIEFDVAGPGREEVLGPVLPQGYMPTAITGGLPARLDPDGKLHIQVRPGTWTLDILARALAPLEKLTAKPALSPWPAQEIWSYESVSSLRVTNASSAVLIDPAQAGVPNEWRALPAFAMQKDSVLSIEERARGLASADANRLHLSREAWLDFSGAGMFAKDRIYGRMVRDWRLDVATPYALLRADADGEGLLVTRGTDAKANGVELRNPNVNLSAGIRVDKPGGELPIAGWRQAFDSVGITLHLPYGYRLLAAPGADKANGTWIERWTLLDLFIVAITVLLAWRLLGALGGLAVAGYLLLGYQEFGMPLWTLGAVLLFELIRKVLPMGKLARFCNGLARVALIGLVLVALPFVADQVRFSLYPQLENTASTYSVFAHYRREAQVNEEMQLMKDAKQEYAQAYENVDSQPTGGMNAPPAPPAAPNSVDQERGSMNQLEQDKPLLEKSLRGEIKKLALGKKGDAYQAQIQTQTTSTGFLNSKINRYAENTNIQAGRGEPGWQYGSTYSLSWQGPVLPEQNMRLLIASPWMVRSLRILLVALLGLIVIRLVKSNFSRSGHRPSARAVGVLGMLLIASHAFLPQPVKAENYPAADLLNELRTRLIQAPKCVPDCATLAFAQVRAQGDNVHIVIEAQAGERVALPLPSEEKNLALKSFTLDGVAQDGLLRKDEQLWAVLPRGVHRIEMTFSVLAVDQISLPFPLKPARIEFSGTGWEASGISEDHLLTETLDLVRLRQLGVEPARGTTQQFSPYVALIRNLRLDLDWQLENDVQRIAPTDGGFSVELALLKNEHVTSAQFKVKSGRIMVPMPDGVSATSWSSQLEKDETISADKAETITLTAPPITDHAEVWKIVVSPTWHAEFTGVPATQSQDTGNYWTHEFHPLPGETLTIKISRPEGTAGSSKAIDAVSLASTIGARAIDHALTLSMRSTQGGEHVIELAKDVEVLGVSKNGQSLNLRPREGKLSLPLTPGGQSFNILWRETRSIGLQADTPWVKLNSPAANISMQLNLPNDRWVLSTTGPAVGPAVLYWGELTVMVLLAFGLTKLHRTPLKFFHWLLLGIGFSTFSWGALLIVAAWLLVLDWRERNPIQHDGAFNLMQIALLILSLGALLCLISSIPFGLLGTPDMHLVGNGSSPTALRWFADQSSDILPQAGVISLPLWVYKIVMLAWALWLANALIVWMRWGFAAWSQGGYWRSTPKKIKQVAPAMHAANEKSSD